MMSTVFRVPAMPRITGLSNNGLEQTGRVGVAHALRLGPVVGVAPRSSTQCYPGRCGTTRGGLNSIGKPTDSAAHE